MENENEIVTFISVLFICVSINYQYFFSSYFTLYFDGSRLTVNTFLQYIIFEIDG